ncbi:MAG: TRAP transporter large permease subunit [Clostridium fessum]
MIITPLLLPVARQLGINDYHFGLVAIVNIMIGGITPPFGSMMFTTCGITGCPISEFLKEVWPFILSLLIVLLILTLLPVPDHLRTGSPIQRGIRGSVTEHMDHQGAR